VLGLRVKFHKSKVGGIGLYMNVLDNYVMTLNYDYMAFPFKYLGVLIGRNPRKNQFWMDVFHKIRKKLSIWGRRMLSMADRVCLINYIISTIPLFYPFVFKTPKSICKEITKRQRNFLWGWGYEESKVA